MLHNQLLNEALLFLNFFGDSSTLDINAQEFILQHAARKRKRRNVYVCGLHAAAGFLVSSMHKNSFCSMKQEKEKEEMSTYAACMQRQAAATCAGQLGGH